MTQPQRVVLATHYLLTGAPTALHEYLAPKVDRYLFIAHPLFVGRDQSTFGLYHRGSLVKSGAKPGPGGVSRYLAEMYRTVRWTLEQGITFDTFVAADSFLALAGLLLRKSRRVSSVVLYSIDFVPKRFDNPLVNRVYHRVDAFASQRADVVWSVSEEIIAARRARDRRETRVPHLVVPVGAHFNRIRKVPLTDANRFEIGFTGHLLEKQGVQLAIMALPRILATVPGATLIIIGDGPYADALKVLARDLGVIEATEFTGRLEDHREVERRLASCALALAPYVPDPLSFTRYADPAKIKTYLACGVPVVTTAVPPSAALIESRGAGRIVDYSVDSLSSAVIDYLTDSPKLQRARDAALDLGSEFSWDEIFQRAWEKTARYLGGKESPAFA